MTLAIIALFCGCATAPDPATLSQFAVAKSNEEAQRLYHVAPFKLQDGNLSTDGNHRVWDALTSSGGFDVVSKVVFDRSGSAISVNVWMQVSTATAPRLDHLLGPNTQSGNTLQTPPEVVPN